MSKTIEMPETRAPAEAARALMSAVPGLDIIRARTLVKAGWDSPEKLRDAPPEALSGVPGITLQKAEWILQTVQIRKTVPQKPAARIKNPPADAVPALPIVPPEAAPAAALPTESSPAHPHLYALARQVYAAVRELLGRPLAQSLEDRLTRQIGKVGAVAEHLAARLENERTALEEGKPLSFGEKTAERIAGEMRKLDAVLTEIAAQETRAESHGSFGGKRQEKYAEVLRDRRRKLERDLA